MEEFYPVHYNDGVSHQFWFVSTGKRNILKCVQLDMMEETEEYYHLSLLDFDHEQGCLREDIVSNNGDTNRVLSTVAHCMILFLHRFPETKIIFTGNSRSRDRLFRIQMNNQFNKIKLLDVETKLHETGSIIFSFTKRKH